MSHTPAPWEVFPTNAKSYVITGDNGAYDVAIVQDIGKHNNAANARLIAAAPELLEALKLAREELGGLPHSLGYSFTHLPKIDAAIAKAEGTK